ncbi:MAG TPA: hypothetical protein VME43_33430 [Bryobacteraceae bacterium]|nr:hypothetical protein [Bryobacteraceae bacterium]
MFRRLLFAVALLARLTFAAPTLTTIQDVLYMANGTRFNGSLTISWSSFQAADNSNIINQSTTVTVVNGNLYVRLVPSTTANPAGYYSVAYNSNGQVQFQELWAVPPSTTPLYVRDVRIGISTTSGSGSGSSGTGTETTPIAESGVTGLVSDLAARPMKGPAFAPGAVAVVDASGLLDSVSGNAGDCVHVDGSTGPCGSQSPSFVDGDTITGIVDGSNTTFSLSAAPNPAASLVFYRNGILQKAGVDFTLNNNSIQFLPVSTPQPGDTLLASYRLAGSAGGSTVQSFPNPEVLCSGTGNTVTNQSLSSMGSCLIPAGLLLPGDRVEIRLDTTHAGTAGGFSVAVYWGATQVLQATAGATETLVTAHADASIASTGAQLGFTSWGAVLPFAAGVGYATDAYTAGLLIDFQGQVAGAGDSVNLANYTVVRIP